MPRSKVISFNEHVRRLSDNRKIQGLSDVTPEVIHQKIDEGYLFKVTVSDEMAGYWQSKLNNDPDDDTAKRILYIYKSNNVVIDGVGYDNHDQCFCLTSVNADDFVFDLPDGFYIRTQEQLDAMNTSTRANESITSFFAELYQADASNNQKPAELTDQQLELRRGITKKSPGPPDEALKLIQLARKKLGLGNSAKPDKIYSWLRMESEKANSDPLFELLEFTDANGQAVAHYAEADVKKTVRDNVVLIWSDRPRTSGTFENWCSKSKKLD